MSNDYISTDISKRENFFPKRAPVLQKGLKLCTQTFGNSSCASNLAALFSPQLRITPSQSLLLGKKSFRKSPGEQYTLSLGKAGEYTSICVHPQPLPAHEPLLHHKAEELGQALMSCWVSILSSHPTSLELLFCFTCSRINQSHNYKNYECLLFTVHRFHSKLSRHKGGQGSTGGLSGYTHRAGEWNTKLSSSACTLLSAVQTLWGHNSSESTGDRSKILAR